MSKVQNTTIHTPYPDRAFDWIEISDDLKTMRDILARNNQPDASLLCDNAQRMITRLWTMTHEALLPLHVVDCRLNNGDIEGAKDALNTAKQILKTSTKMQPEQVDGGKS